ncbi:MAG: agmatine deiminase family protein [Saprospiraceae bacterium]|nr:agmatine deiminase family protein [Saprospiraceae bacterium]
MAYRRLPAEWEPQSAVQFTFPHADSDWAESLEEVIPCFVECITQVSRFEKVVVVCADVDKTRALIQNARQDNLRLVALPSNDTWARDHGAITVEENGQPVLLDFMFNGWGLKFAADKDNLITAGLWQQGVFGHTPRRVAGLVFEGGGIESDGQGTLLTTAECLLSPNRNPHLSQKEIEAQLADLLGAERVMWLHHGYLAGDDTDSHIDTLARFCRVDTIAYAKCTDVSDEHYGELAKMEAELQQMPYKLVPLPWPDACYADDGHRLPATYANFLIINGAVLVPTYGVAQDGEALRVLQGCFPDREVIGINCRALIEQHGSLHCISMQFPEGVVD